MSPEAVAAAATLARLNGELNADRSAMGARADEVRELLADWGQRSSDRAQLALAAVALHAWYTALETLLERVARTIDRTVPGGNRSHAELLSQMMVEIPGVRPAVLKRACESSLIALLSFRHFFRHAYAVELDPLRLEAELRRVDSIEPKISQSLAEFEAFLNAAIMASNA